MKPRRRRNVAIRQHDAGFWRTRTWTLLPPTPSRRFLGLGWGDETHHLQEISPIEAILRVLVDVLHHALEAALGVVRAFGMRIIGREQEKIGAGIGDHSARILVREGREFDGAA